jgi:ubiquinone/menaquinone biosynthesis C-methylase UbiE
LNQSLMSYISSNPTQGARKYTGSVATGYDAKRTESPKWHAEQAILEGIIDALPAGSKIIDVPVGTGRLIAAYERNEHKWFGVDLSEDMLMESSSKVTKPTDHAALYKGDVTKLDKIVAENSVDCAFMIRLTRWLNPEQRTIALKQLQRVSRSKIVFTARIANHPYAYPIEAIEAAIEPGWHIADNIEAGEQEYRVFVLERE